MLSRLRYLIFFLTNCCIMTSINMQNWKVIFRNPPLPNVPRQGYRLRLKKVSQIHSRVEGGQVEGHMQTEVKIDMRHPSVNGIMSQFLNVKIVAIIFVILLFFMLMLFFLVTYIFPNLFQKLKYHISGIFNFSIRWQLTNIGGTFLKVGRNCYLYIKRIYYRKNAPLLQMGGCKEQWSSGQGTGFPIQGSRVQNQWLSPKSIK